MRSTAFYQKILMCRSRILNIYLQLRKKIELSFIIISCISDDAVMTLGIFFMHDTNDYLPTYIKYLHRYFFLSWCDLQNHIMYIYFFLHCRIRLPVDYWRHVMDRFVCKNMLIIVCCLLTLANRKKDFLLTFTGYLLRVLVQHIKTKFLKSFFCT